MNYVLKVGLIAFLGLVIMGVGVSPCLGATLAERLAMAGYSQTQIQGILNGKTTVKKLQKELHLSMAGYSAPEIKRMLEVRKPKVVEPPVIPEPPVKDNFVTAWQRSHRYQPIVSLAAGHFNIEKPLILAIIQAESNFNPRAVSKKGALGLMQLMPQTAKELGVTKPFNPYQNIMAGTRFLSQCLQRFHDLPTALVAYNAGPAKAHTAANMASVKAYIKRVLAFQAQFHQAFKSSNIPI